MFKLDLEKAEEPEINCQHPLGHQKSKRVPEKHILLLYCLRQSLWLCQFSSVAQSCPTLCDPMNHSMSGLPVHHQFPESTQTHFHWVSDAIQPSYPLSSPSPTINLSSIRVFSNELALPSRWSDCWNFCFSVSRSNEYSGLISFRIDWFDLLAVQETLKNLLHHHNLKASVLQHSAFFMVQLSHLYMTTGRNIALTIGTFAGKVMSLLFKMLSRFVIAFQGASVFWFHGGSYHPQWFWSLSNSSFQEAAIEYIYYVNNLLLLGLYKNFSFKFQDKTLI